MTFEWNYLRYVIIGNSADGDALCCLIGGRHRAVLIDGRNGEQSADNRADNPDFTVCSYPLCVSRRIDTWQIVYLSYKDICPTISIPIRYIHVP